MAQKKIVSAGPDTTPKQGPGKQGSAQEPTFVATPEAKKKALTYRLIAAALWVVAIAAEAVTIFWFIPYAEVDNFTVWLISAIIIIAAFTWVGSTLWKTANRYDPASEKNKVRFFVQNQLGAIITIVAFLPLILDIFMNKNMDKKQKTTAGIVGIVVALIVFFAAGIDYLPPSVEQIDDDTATVLAYTGQDKVYWVAGGKVYHLCAEYPEGTTIPDLSRGDLETNPVIEGTVAQAVQAGKTRLSIKGFKECGLTEGQPQFTSVPSSSASPEPSSTPS